MSFLDLLQRKNTASNDFIFRNTNVKNSIIGVVQKYLEKVTLYPNNVISSFQKDEHPILHDEVKAIIIGEAFDSVYV